MKRSIVAGVLVLSVVAAGAAPASAKIARGTFTGTTSKADPLGFKVDRKGKVRSFFYDAVTLTCTDGDSFDTPTGADKVQTPRRVKFKVSATRKFGITARNEQTGFGWDAAGTFNAKGSKVTGTLKIFANFNDQNQQDPNGTVRCESGDITWSAKRR
jgi:hypothetical protein